MLLLLKEVTVARPKATLPRQKRRPATTKTKVQTPKRQARKQRSICPVCLQKTAAKKLIVVCTGPEGIVNPSTERIENPLRACVDCTATIRRNLFSYAMAGAQVGEVPEVLHASNMLFALGMRPCDVPFATICNEGDGVPAPLCGGHEQIQLEDTIHLNKVSGTGAIPMGQQQYAECPSPCYSLPRSSIEDPVPPQMADAPDQPPVEVKC